MTLKEFDIQYALGLITFGDVCDMARSLDTPTNMLKILSQNKNISVRYFVAMNTNTPKKILKKLSKDCAQIVCCGATDNLQFNAKSNK